MADIKVSQMGEVLVASDNDLLNLVSYDEQNQTYVSGKVKASTLKSYMVDDLEVSDLYDTTITTPTDDDGLVYNSTEQKWKNKQITTKEQWKKNGAYNLACGVFTSKVENGTTYIANSDGSVSVSGEATGSNITSSTFTLKAGTYLVGFNPIPQSGGVSTDATNLTILDSSNNHLPGLPLNDATSKVITVAEDTVVKIRLYVYANSSGHTTNTTFYPVITTDLNATVADFVSPAKTNLELTEELGTELYSHTVQSSETFRTVLNDLWNNCINSFTGDKSRLKLIWRRTSLGLDYQCPVKIKGGTYLTFGIFGVSSSSESFYQQYQVMSSGSSFLTMTFNTNGTIASYDNSTNNANVGDKFIIAYQ